MDPTRFVFLDETELRKAATRTKDELWSTIGRLLATERQVADLVDDQELGNRHHM